MIRNNGFHINWDGIAFLVGVVLFWEVAATYANTFGLPKATSVGVAMWEDASVLFSQSMATLRRALYGFGIALVFALPLGLFIGRISILADLLEPLTEFLRPLPPIAVIPIAMMLLGIGDAAKLVVVVYGTAFPILVNTIDAVRIQDPMQAHLARSLRLTTFERMIFVDLPAALPQIFAGIRLAITLSLLLTVVAEMILSTDGLGDYLRRAQSNYSPSHVVGGIISIALLSVSVLSVTNIISRRVLSWHVARTASAGI